VANQTQAELFARLQAAGFNPYAQGVSQADAELYAKLSAAVSSTNGQAYKNQTLAEEYAALSAASPLVLDQLSALPAAAYSLRRLTQTYAGPAINVRRDSDNAVMDIGFIGNSLDTITLLAFCGSGSGYVTTWYNQGTLGSSGNLTQYAAAYDPRIVNNGSLVTVNGRPALDFSENTTSFLNVPNVNSPSGMTAAAFNFVGSFAPNGTSSIIPYTVGGSASNAMFLYFVPNSGSPYVNLVDFGVSQSANIGITTGVPTIFTAAADSSLRLYMNGSLAATLSNTIAFGTGSGLRLGQNYGSSYWQGMMTEVIQTTIALPAADHQTLEHNQESYYGISGL